MPVDYDYCQKIKCGIIPQSDVPMDDLYQCSAQFGAGALWPCHSDCVQYGRCPSPPVALPLPIQALPTTEALQRIAPPPEVPVEILTIEKLIQPVPDIVALQVPIVVDPPQEFVPCSGGWEGLNAAISDNPLTAVLVLAGGLWLLAGMKGGRK